MTNMKTLLAKYASLAVRVGTNVQPGQYMVINAPVEASEFVTMCQEEAYKAGARKVEIRWNCSNSSLIDYTYAATDELKNFPSWIEQRYKYGIDQEFCILHIISETPGLLKDIDATKLQEVELAYSKMMKPYRYYTMNSVGQWSIVAVPNPLWAKTIYPDLSEEQGIAELWKQIFKAVRISDDNDPVKEWRGHLDVLKKHARLLNDMNLLSLHFKNEKGTDLTVELPEGYIFGGGEEDSSKGITFVANIPTEEVFSMPKRSGVNGKVYATKPLNYQGKLIEDFWLEFKDGRVENYHAEKNEDVLKNLLDTDEGSRYLGEVALISYQTPISLSNILFYETLFDENASCHLALGDSYPTCIKGGDKMSEEELLAHEANVSMNHCDFMFGSKDMNIVGTDHNGKQIAIFKDGNFCI